MSTKRIMVADDEAPIRFAATRILKMAGYEAFEACDGYGVIKLAEQCALAGDPIDLVITDYSMPGMDCEEVLSALAGMTIAPRVLVMTGTIDQRRVTAVAEFQCEGVIYKPFAGDKLLEEVSRALAGENAHAACGEGQVCGHSGSTQ